MSYKIIKIDANVIIEGANYGDSIEFDYPEHGPLDSLGSVKTWVARKMRRVAGQRAEEYAEDLYLEGRYSWRSGVTAVVRGKIDVEDTETEKMDTVYFAWGMVFVDIDVYDNEWRVGDSWEDDYNRNFYYEKKYKPHEEPEPPADKELDDDEIPPSAYTIEPSEIPSSAFTVDPGMKMPDGLDDDLQLS